VILLLDIGNSRIKWGCWHAGNWHGRGAVPVSEPEALQAMLVESAPTWAGVSCVAGHEIRERLATLLGTAGVEVFWLHSAATGHGLVNRYEQPESLGVDRYAALIACNRNGYTPCVVASAGTAVTVDALAVDGEFLGGMILPGARLMRRSLDQGTAGVADLDGAWQAFPRTTGQAVETGIWTAIAAAVSAMHGRLSERLGMIPATMLTGGDARMLADRLRGGGLSGLVSVNDYLVLEGLLWVARDLAVPGV
jgi:type III pantothenate kinase